MRSQGAGAGSKLGRTDEGLPGPGSGLPGGGSAPPLPGASSRVGSWGVGVRMKMLMLRRSVWILLPRSSKSP